jgi:integrase/recombinase XerD
MDRREVAMDQINAMVPIEIDRLANQVDDQALLISTWLRTKGKKTQVAYRQDITRFLSVVGKPLSGITLPDLQDYADSLIAAGLAGTSQQRMLAAVKSLFTFGHRTGYLHYDVGKAIKLPKVKDRLAERILSEEEVIKMIALEQNVRNRAFLRLLYYSGGRVSEICALSWRDLKPRDNAAQVTLFGKGEKTRAVLVPSSVWQELSLLRNGASADAPLFVSRKGKGSLTSSQAWRIVKAAAQRAGISGDVSPHWFRHSHASHAIENGAPLHLIQQTLGHSSLAITGRYTHARPTDSSSMYLKS